MKYFLAILIALLTFPFGIHAQEVEEEDPIIIDIHFPLDGEASFTDDFDSPRGDGIHEAIDILAEKMTPILAAVDGTITYAPDPEPSYGYMLSLEGDEGYTYHYIHINNDTPGTDDGEGGVENAYVDGIERGTRVERGEHIAWVGDSGNAESTVSHLHFEIEAEDGIMINPYESLLAASSAISYDPELESSLATSINLDQDIPPATEPVNCESDTLIRTEEVSTVYYCGQDGGRYVFQNESTYFSWYEDFDNVEFVTTEEMASIPLKGVVTYKPGTYLVKIVSIPNVYAVTRDGTLRWVRSPDIAESLYGPEWTTLVRDIPDGFFGAYQIGEDIVSE